MATGLAHRERGSVRDDARTRRLYVVWQHPETRRFVTVGCLEVTPEGYAFEYEPEAAREPGFEGFAAFPDFRHRYRSDRLFSFFANRVLSPRRPEYTTYLDALALEDDALTPVEMLARSGAARATDTVHIVPEPQRLPDGREVLVFLASGVRHLPSAESRIAQLHSGDQLHLRDELDNEVNPDAVLIDTDSGEPVGWIPDYLLDTVHDYRARGPVHVYVERANGPPAPSHLRLLCRLEARPGD